jgi:hypothetical protein
MEGALSFVGSSERELNGWKPRKQVQREERIFSVCRGQTRMRVPYRSGWKVRPPACSSIETPEGQMRNSILLTGVSKNRVAGCVARLLPGAAKVPASINGSLHTTRESNHETCAICRSGLDEALQPTSTSTLCLLHPTTVPSVLSSMLPIGYHAGRLPKLRTFFVLPFTGLLPLQGPALEMLTWAGKKLRATQVLP